MGDYDIDWQAWATLATGIMAVIGAVIVGLRQVKISERQTAILDRQAGIEEAKLRADLFERRMETYEVTVDFLSNMSMVTQIDPAHTERWRAFREKVRESRFLFRDSVFHTLTEIEKKASAQQRAFDEFDSISADDRYDPNRSKLVNERMEWQLYTIDRLPGIFEDDLRIKLPYV